MKLTSILEGVALGAGLMYILDPQSGRRRQTMAKDRIQKQIRHKQEALGVMQRDFMNRSRGMVTQIRSARTHGDVVADEIVEARIRSALGRVCTHPRTVHCEVHNGEVTLTGLVLSQESEQVVECVQRTKGVQLVTNNLELVQDPSHVPSLQGQGSVAQPGIWNPALGLVMVSCGGLMAAYGMLRRGIVGTVISTAGLGIVAKAFSDTEDRFMPRMNTSSQSIAAGGSVSEGQEQSMEGFQGMNMSDAGATNQIAALPSTPDDNAGMV